jgi:hypothetical protein
MIATLQPFLIEATGTVQVAGAQVALPAERVQTCWHPRGYQVAVTRGGECRVLAPVYAECYDAERAAVAIALKLDVTLVCEGDPDGEIADDWVNRCQYSSDNEAKYTAWMY